MNLDRKGRVAGSRSAHWPHRLLPKSLILKQLSSRKTPFGAKVLLSTIAEICGPMIGGAAVGVMLSVPYALALGVVLWILT